MTCHKKALTAVPREDSNLKPAAADKKLKPYRIMFKTRHPDGKQRIGLRVFRVFDENRNEENSKAPVIFIGDCLITKNRNSNEQEVKEISKKNCLRCIVCSLWCCDS